MNLPITNRPFSPIERDLPKSNIPDSLEQAKGGLPNRLDPPGPLNHDFGPPTKKSSFLDSWLPSKSANKNSAKVEPKNNKKAPPPPSSPPRTIPKLKAALFKKDSLTQKERAEIIATAKKIAGYEYKDWQAKKVATELLKNKPGHGFSDTDRKAIKDVFIKKK
jgi:hypothetical protein